MGEQSERFGDLLRRYRQAAECSQEELAERAGLSKNAIGALERGERRHPHPDTLRRLTAALGLSAAEHGRLAAAARAAYGPPPGASRETEPAGSAHRSLALYDEALIGREREIEEVQHLLRQPAVRLLTLTGTGGVGKTRLAIEVARRARAHFTDSAAFVPLALVQDPRLVIAAIARTLGLSESGKQALRETLHGYLRERELLLVLDNCEHLLQGSQGAQAARDIADLLGACPRGKVVATSRAPLRLHGEQEYLVPPLGVPDLSRMPLSVEEVARAASVQFFVHRAQQVSSAFALTSSNALAVAGICRRLDGLPLAIELAAARVKVLPPADLLARLGHALPLLTDGARDLPERQQTMRTTLAWSYDLLDGREQTLFRCLAIFAGGWTLEAAEAVGADAEGAAEVGGTEGILGALCGLVDQSLVVVEQAADRAPRYRMLEPVRQYAAERLEQSGEATAVRNRHATYYLRLAEQADSRLRRATQLIWFDRLDEEQANLRAALSWLIEEGAPEASLRLAGALGWFWFIRGYLSEGRAWLRRTCTAFAQRGTTTEETAAGAMMPTEAPARARALALNRAGMLAWLQGDFSTARQQFEEGLALSRTLGDEAGAALALAPLAAAAQDQREYPALRAQLEESVALLREAGDTWGTALALSFLGHGLFEPDAEVARGRNLESVHLFREVGDRWGIGFALIRLGEVALSRGEYYAARSCSEESLELHRELRHGLGVAVALTNLGEIARLQGYHERAKPYYREALARFEEIGNETDIPRVLHNLGRVARQQGDDPQAMALLGESLARFRRLGFHRGVAECLAGFAGLALDHNEPERAAVLLGWVEARFRALGTAMWAADRAEYERDVAAARGRLSEADFDGAWAKGCAMSYDEMIAYVLTCLQPHRNTDRS